MNISRQDRDKLRSAQQTADPHRVVGHLIEHQVQDPKLYAALSDSQRSSVDETSPSTIRTVYKGRFQSDVITKTSYLSTISENQELDLPIDVSEIHSNSWLHMDQVEFDKLEWMTIKAERKRLDQIKGTTRFDKKGRALPPLSESNDEKMATDDEGHDIESLVNLLDSTYQPKIGYAMNVIERIASLASSGYHDGLFSENIHQLLIKKCLLRVRHNLDSSNQTIVHSAFKCLRALICNTRIDEVILDRIHPLLSDSDVPNMWLQTEEMESKAFTIEMKDDECIEVDAVLALIRRTAILKRLSYLLEQKLLGPSLSNHECLLDLLIRIARHSINACLAIANEDGLLRSIVDSFLPLNITNERKETMILSTKSLKLIRIISQALILTKARSSFAEKDLAKKLPPTVLKVIESYFLIDCHSLTANQNYLSGLLIETLRLMKTLFKLELFRGNLTSTLSLGRDKFFLEFRTFTRLIATKPIESAISFDWQYVAHLIDLTGYSMRHEKYNQTDAISDSVWSTYIQPTIFKWLQDLNRERIIPHIDISIALSTALRHMMKRGTPDEKKMLISIVMCNTTREELADKIPPQSLYKDLIRSATDKSELLKVHLENGRLRDPTGLPSYGFLQFNTGPECKFKLCKVFERDSPYLLLDSFIHLVGCDATITKETLSALVNNIELLRYVRSPVSYHNLPYNFETFVQDSLVAQIEVRLIVSALSLIGKLYLRYLELDGDRENAVADTEPEALRDTRVICYSNLMYYLVSIIGLLNASTDQVLELKDKLFENFLLHSRFHSRISEVTFSQNDRAQEADEISKLKERDFIGCTSLFGPYSQVRLNTLITIYASYQQPDRFWIFQPLIDYYDNEISPPNGNGGEHSRKTHRWFQENVEWRAVTAEFSICDDHDILATILSFNYTLMRNSPAYSKLIMRANLEEYLCIIGTLFLDDDLFLNEKLSSTIADNVRLMLKLCIDTSEKGVDAPFKDASKLISNIQLPLGDFFNKLVEQYEAASYCDVAFSNFLALFMTPYADKKFKSLIFREKVETCIRQFHLTPCELWSPTSIFFNTKEQDEEVKALMIRAKPFINRTSFLYEYVQFLSR